MCTPQLQHLFEVVKLQMKHIIISDTFESDVFYSFANNRNYFHHLIWIELD